jgi:2'-5' RNA ligase
LRLFTGISIPPNIGDRLVHVMNSVRSLPGLRLTTRDKLHLTVTFIGEWPEERLEELKTALANVAIPEPIDIGLARLGWLPNERFPRILYAGVSSTDALQQLASATTEVVAKLGAKPDRRRAYRPHITLGHVDGRPELDRSPNSEVGDIGTFQASSFFLYMSANGKYTRLQEFPTVTS